METKTRWELLAGLRFVLAWVVLCSHVIYYGNSVDSITRFGNELGGKAAVLGFFLVSGYSIAASLQRSQTGFYRRRLLRIYPLYLLAVVVTVALQYATGGTIHLAQGNPIVGNTLPTAIGHLLFLQTFVVHALRYDGPLWSLAIEVSYYVVAPLLPKLPRWFPLLVIAVSAGAYALPRHDGSGTVYFIITHLNALTWAWAWFMGYALFTYRGHVVALAFAAVGTGLIWWNTRLNPESLPAVTFLVTLALIHFVQGRPTRPAAARVLNLLGDISYPLYLLQFPAIIAGYWLFGISGSFGMLAISLLVAAAAVFGVERPVNHGVRKWVGRQARPSMAEGLASQA